MPYSAALVLPSPPVFTSTLSFESIGLMVKNILGTTPASLAIGTANLGIYVPFSLRKGVTVTKLVAYNGATANGTTDLAVYRDDYTAVINIAAASQTGTNILQEYDCTDTYLSPGNYYWGLVNSGTTGTYFAYTSLPLAKMCGVYSQAIGAANLPDPMVPATMAAVGIVPIIGMLCSPQSAI